MTRLRAASLLLLCAFPAACGKTDSDPTAPAENTIAACSDGIDNDGDGWIDCDDQDCLVFAMCVSTPDTGGSDTAVDASDAHEDTADTGDTSNDPETGIDGAFDSETSDLIDDGTDGDDGSDTLDVDADTTPGACYGAALCIESTITIETNVDPVNGIPSSEIFVPLIGEPLQIIIGCDVAATGLRGFYEDIYDGITRWVECDVVGVDRISGEPAALVETIVAALASAEVTLEFEDSAFWDSRFGGLAAIGLVDGAGFSIEWGSFPLELDESGEGVPQLTEFTNGTPSVYVQRFVDDELVDYASGSALLSLTRTVP